MNQFFTYSGTATLETLHNATNYNRFIESQIAAFITPETSALDFGAGLGEFAIRINNVGIAVDCVELDDEQCAYIRTKKLNCFKTIDEAPQQKRIYSLNVLEHIEDDAEMLQKLHNKLEKGGKLLLYVPAFMSLYSDFDKHVGHYRRYSRKELIKKTRQAGFHVERCVHVDCIGFMCWYLMARLPGNKTSLNLMLVKLFDQLIFPMSLCLDRAFGAWFGKNLLLVAQKI